MARISRNLPWCVALTYSVSEFFHIIGRIFFHPWHPCNPWSLPISAFRIKDRIIVMAPNA